MLVSVSLRRGVETGGGDLRVRLDQRRRRGVAAEDGAHRGVLDHGELDAETDDYGEDEGHDEELKEAQAAHRALGPVEDEDEQDVGNGDGAAGDEGEFGDEQVEGDGRADDLGLSVSHVSGTCAVHTSAISVAIICGCQYNPFLVSKMTYSTLSQKV